MLTSKSFDLLLNVVVVYPVVGENMYLPDVEIWYLLVSGNWKIQKTTTILKHVVVANLPGGWKKLLNMSRSQARPTPGCIFITFLQSEHPKGTRSFSGPPQGPKKASERLWVALRGPERPWVSQWEALRGSERPWEAPLGSNLDGGRLHSCPAGSGNNSRCTEALRPTRFQKLQNPKTTDESQVSLVWQMSPVLNSNSGYMQIQVQILVFSNRYCLTVPIRVWDVDNPRKDWDSESGSSDTALFALFEQTGLSPLS